MPRAKTPVVTELPLSGDAIELIQLEEEMERSFLEYSMSVIVSRALPDVRDGLKPVHRRILYSMFAQRLMPDRPHTKCAKVVGEVMGNFHPHGDSSIYDALVRMVQEFSMRHPLVDGHGNFGGQGPNEGAAAMRYTEARLASLALDLMAGIDEETVDFIPNYDNTDQEPVVLPSRYPNLLVNGSQGIAVGMATNIPPHNLGEVVDATLHLLENPEATSDDLMKFVKGPDFPTGAQILGREGIHDAYRTGRGSIKLRAVVSVEEGKGGAEQLVVSEFPFQVSVEVVEEAITELVKSGEIEGIAALQNDSAGQQPRLIIRLKKGANTNLILNKLYKHTKLQTTFGFNMLALVDGVPRTLSLAQALTHHIAHQVEVLTRRSQFRLDKAERRAHIVEGLLKAIDMLDKVIATIRKSDDRPAATKSLMAKAFGFSEEQARHILDMTLGRLTRLGKTELEAELKQLMEEIAYLKSILGDDAKLRAVIAEEMTAIRDATANKRRSAITLDSGDIEVEDLVKEEDIVITMTKAGYIKATNASAFSAQGRTGRAAQVKMKAEDVVTQVIHATSMAYLLLFSNQGRVFRLRGHEVPLKDRTAKGTAVVNILNLGPGETIETIVPLKEMDENGALLFVTKQGLVKKTALSEYDKSRREGFAAIKLNAGDELVQVVPSTETQDCFIVTGQGMTIRFASNEVREMGRVAAGVRGINLKAGDHVVSLSMATDEADVLLVTDAGFAKRVKLDRFNAQSRGGQGVRGMKLSANRGHIASAFMVDLDDTVLIVSSDGLVSRTPVREIPSQNREAVGAKLMDLGADQSVAAVAKVGDEE